MTIPMRATPIFHRDNAPQGPLWRLDLNCEPAYRFHRARGLAPRAALDLARKMPMHRFTTGERAGLTECDRYTSWGCYPLYYVDARSNVLCPTCALESFADDNVRNHAAMCDVNYEDGNMECDACNGRIESAYAEDDVGDDVEGGAP